MQTNLVSLPSRAADILREVDKVGSETTESSDYLARILKLMAGVTKARQARLWTADESGVHMVAQTDESDAWWDIQQAGAMQAFQALECAITGIPDAESGAPALCSFNVPITDSYHCVAVATLVTDYDSLNKAEAHLAILAAIAERVGRTFAGSYLAEAETQLAIGAKAREVCEAMEKHLALKPLAYEAVARLVSYLEVDRVVIATKLGQQCVVQAVSNQAVFDRRSNLINHLEKLTARVMRMAEPLLHPSSQPLPPSLQQAVDRYVELSHDVNLAMLPIMATPKRRDNPQDLAATIGTDKDNMQCIAIVVLEGLETPVDFSKAQRRMERIHDALARALKKSLEHEKIFLLPVWRKLGGWAELYRGHTQRKAVLITSLVAIALLAMVATPGQFKVRGEGLIQPIQRQHIYALTDGKIEQLMVADGDRVQAGTPLLRMRNPELSARVAEVSGKLREAEAQYRTTTMQRVMKSARSEQEERELVRNATSTKARMDGLRQQLELLEQNEQQLQLLSPIAGEVITWDVEQRLRDRPVKPGQRLLTVAVPESGWEIELKVPDKRAGYLLKYWEEQTANSQPVKASFVLSSDIRHVHEGVVTEISPSSNSDEAEQENVIRVKVRVPEEQLARLRDVKTGTTVTGHLHCGTAPWAYCKLYEFFDWTRRAWFRFVS